MDGDPPQKAAHYEGKAVLGAAGHGLDAACKLVTRRYLQEALCTRKLRSETRVAKGRAPKVGACLVFVPAGGEWHGQAASSLGFRSRSLEAFV